MQAVIASTSGYRAEIAERQSRHLPRNASHETMGILSNQRIRCLHVGQCDGGVIKLIALGIRYTTTFKKLPIAAPTTKNQTTNNVSSAILQQKTYGYRQSRYKNATKPPVYSPGAK
jgi:hypothetical protein